MIADALHLDFSAVGSNAEPWLGEGWHGSEVGHRWTDGVSSVLRLPAFKPQPWFVLTIQCWPFNPPGVVQTATVVLNGIELLTYRPPHLPPFAIAIPGDIVHADSENLVVINHPHATSPALTKAANGDTRTLALAVQTLDFEPLDGPLHLAPRLLREIAAPDDLDEAKTVVEAFQSLGQNCGFGVVQRHYKAEPQGLLRFASLHPEHLIRALRTRFADIGDPDRLSFRTFDDRPELIGHHTLYGLDYHTQRVADETDVAAFTQTEAKRLAYTGITRRSETLSGR